MTDDAKLLVERVQTGVRIEKRILKVLKAFAEYHDMTLGDVLEGIVLHAFRWEDTVQCGVARTHSRVEEVL
jgi:predicted DNA-binding ribbon-helix-helix protein